MDTSNLPLVLAAKANFWPLGNINLFARISTFASAGTVIVLASFACKTDELFNKLTVTSVSLEPSVLHTNMLKIIVELRADVRWTTLEVSKFLTGLL